MLRGEKVFRKSQAAMEFLMTYGWAILVVLVAIGALSYFGVLSPDRFLPNRCTLPAGLACLDHYAQDIFGPGNGIIPIVFKNSLGYDIGQVTIRASKCTSGSLEGLIKNGENSRVLYAFGCTLTEGERYSGDINITYTNMDSGLTHVAKGTMTTKVRGPS